MQTSTRNFQIALGAIILLFGFQNCEQGFDVQAPGLRANLSSQSSQESERIFSVQPASATIEETKSYVLTGSISDARALYQWQFKSVSANFFSDIEGATLSQLNIPFMSPEYAGSYRLKATLGRDVYYSDPAVVTVRDFATTCSISDLSLSVPIAGTQGKNWTVSNFAEAFTYDGHDGLDLAIGTFRAMAVGTDVLAAADGKVIHVHDGEFDRNVNGALSEAISNTVIIQHYNGFTTSYLHLKKSSVMIREGDYVRAGDKIAQVGSSGKSSNPHLHFSLRDCSGKSLDPMTNLQGKISYQTPLQLMELVMTEGKIPDTAAFFSTTQANITTMKLGSYLGLGLALSGGKINDVINISYYRPDGSKAHEVNDVAKKNYSFSAPLYWYGMNTPGTWQVRVALNGSVVSTHNLTVTGSPAPTPTPTPTPSPTPSPTPDAVGLEVAKKACIYPSETNLPAVRGTGELEGWVEPISYADGKYYLTGWVCSIKINTPVDIHVYLDGPAGRGIFKTAAKTTLTSPAVVYAHCGTNSSIPHSFKIDITSWTTSAKERGKRIYVHGLNPSGRPPYYINASGRCAVPVP